MGQKLPFDLYDKVADSKDYCQSYRQKPLGNRKLI